MIRISLIYDHRNRTPKGEEGPVEVRVTVNRKPLYINTGVKVTQDRLVGNCIRDVKVKGADGVWRLTEDADTLNERLTTIVRLVENEVNKCLDERKPLDVAEIRRKVYDLGVRYNECNQTGWVSGRNPAIVHLCAQPGNKFMRTDVPRIELIEKYRRYYEIDACRRAGIRV